jgi:hypothetical protein
VEVQGRKAMDAKVGQPVTLIVQVADDGVPKRRSSGLAGAAVANTGSRRDVAADTPPESQAPIRVNRATLPPARVTVGKNVGLHVSWLVYRGKGSVTFTPEQVMSWEDTRAGANSPWAPVWVPPAVAADGNVSVQATFWAPGVYVLRARADDGALTADGHVTITVTP